MKVEAIEPHGFCWGVKAAVEKAVRALAEHARPVYCLHELVHNARVVGELERDGMVFVDSLDAVPDGAVVLFSAHGVPPAVRDDAAKRGLRVVYATCPFVARAHRQLADFALYELIFLSKTKKAFEFQQWVFSGVLPSFEKMSGIKTLRQISLKPNRETLRKTLVPHAKLNYTQMICKSLGLPFDVDKNKLPDDILANFAYRQNIVNNMLLEGRQYWEIQNFLLGDKK